MLIARGWHIVVHEARFAGERDTRETAKILSVSSSIVLKYKEGIETGVRTFDAHVYRTRALVRRIDPSV